MRKCDSCGYLLLGDGDNCNHCGAALAKALAGATLVAAPPAAPAPASTAATPTEARRAPPNSPPAPELWSERPRPAGPSFAAPPPPSAPPGPPRDFWSPPTEAVVQAPSSRRLPARTIATFIVLALLGAVVGFRFISNRGSVPPGTSEFASGHGVDFVARDGSFSAQFPVQPRVDSRPITVQQYSANILMASVTTNDYELGAASMTLPAFIPANRADELLDDALKGGLSAANGKLVSKKFLDRGGYRALEATFKAPDGYTAHVLVMGQANKLFILFVHAKTGTDTLYRALDKSFVPNLSM